MVIALLAALALSLEPARIPSKVVTINRSNGTLAEVLAEFSRQVEMPVTVPAAVGTVPCSFNIDKQNTWAALQNIAKATNMRIELRDHGRTAALAKRQGPSPIESVDGPFRVSLRQVRSILDYETGLDITELTVDIHWEPRITVFRIDAEPLITESTNDRGEKIIPLTTRGKTPPDGAIYSTTIRLKGITRAASALTRIKGSFVITAADRTLSFQFPLTNNFPLTQTHDGVTVSVIRAGRIDERFEVEVLLTYPPNHPEFESFESFVTGNQATIMTPAKSWPATDPEIAGGTQRIAAIYRFPVTVSAGASFVYTTPAPLFEYPIQFDFRDILLP